MPALAITLAASRDPDVGSWVPYVVALGLVGLLVVAAVVWLLRGRTARRGDRHRDTRQP
jgi:hypothetical protein